MKWLTMIPFIIFSTYNAWRYYYGGFNQIMAIDFFLNFFPLYCLVVYLNVKSKMSNWIDTILHSAFYVYIFYLWFYTITYIPYYHLFNEELLPTELRVWPTYNIYPFATINGSVTALNIYGNALLLFPLGVMLPLMYPKLKQFRSFILIAFLTVAFIENTQYIVGYIDGFFFEYPYDRSWDVDDFILNIAGATAGYFVSKFILISVRQKLNLYVPDFKSSAISKK